MPEIDGTVSEILYKTDTTMSFIVANKSTEMKCVIYDVSRIPFEMIVKGMKIRAKGTVRIVNQDEKVFYIDRLTI